MSSTALSSCNHVNEDERNLSRRGHVIIADHRASAALLKDIIMAGFGLIVLAQAGYRLVSPEVPDFQLMGVTGALALAANITCLLLLTRHRNDDLNMRSTWLCSRNDIIANAGVLVAAGSVFATSSM